eukprot:gb/GFBE01051699.1/.p1 GENE.gb/GFBE01051699.1/~~gb/GFBE01051699.1/.p1  ORF type:complete len:407 (+),score=33.00 gb/GFBE01051699.1/:1-1221(+)
MRATAGSWACILLFVLDVKASPQMRRHQDSTLQVSVGADGHIDLDNTVEYPVQDEDTDQSLLESSTGCTKLSHDLVDPLAGSPVNAYDKEFTKECVEGEAIVALSSEYGPHYKDRRWKIHCGEIKGAGATLGAPCSGWTPKTAYDAKWQQVGGGDVRILTGMKSKHDNKKEDREWEFKFCTLKGVSKSSEKWDTGWRNQYDKPFSVQASGTQWFRGIETEHNNRNEDRIWKFMFSEYCLAKVDCVYGAWETWTACSQECSGGERTRTREQKSGAANGGTCGKAEEQEICNTNPCVSTCEVSTWSEWSDCPVTCGTATLSRTREITKRPIGGGACPEKDNLQEDKDCAIPQCEGPTVPSTTVTTKPGDTTTTTTTTTVVFVFPSGTIGQTSVRLGLVVFLCLRLLPL